MSIEKFIPEINPNDQEIEKADLQIDGKGQYPDISNIDYLAPDIIKDPTAFDLSMHLTDDVEKFADSSELGLDLQELLDKYPDLEEMDVEILGRQAYLYLSHNVGRNPFPRNSEKANDLAMYCHYKYKDNNLGEWVVFPEMNSQINEAERNEILRLLAQQDAITNTIYQKKQELNKKFNRTTQAGDKIVYSTELVKETDGALKEYNSLSLNELYKLLSKCRGKLDRKYNKIMMNSMRDSIPAQKSRGKVAGGKTDYFDAMFKKLPEFTEFEIRESLQPAYEYFNRHNKKVKPKRPTTIDGQSISDEKLLEAAQEYASLRIGEGKSTVKTFFTETLKNGQRQLSTIVNSSGIRYKYVYPNPVLPSGRYAFEYNLDEAISISPKFMIVPIKSLINLGDSTRVIKEINDNIEVLRSSRGN